MIWGESVNKALTAKKPKLTEISPILSGKLTMLHSWKYLCLEIDKRIGIKSQVHKKISNFLAYPVHMAYKETDKRDTWEKNRLHSLYTRDKVVKVEMIKNKI